MQFLLEDMFPNRGGFGFWITVGHIIFPRFPQIHMDGDNALYT